MSAQSQTNKLDLGANFTSDDLVKFKVWAPYCKKVSVELQNKKKTFKLERDGQGYFTATVKGINEGDEYFYILDGKQKRPDPVSRLLSHGPHGPTTIIKPSNFKWTDSKYKSINLKDYILYELHVGTFTNEGTFAALIDKLPYLKELGITCIGIMPIAQFPGKRNWGYDGVSLYAVQNSYGGPEEFKRFINEAHRHGLAVCLDVVYNHFGPEGNYLADFGPYFSQKYSTPWGQPINYDGKESNHVRNFIINNALYWINEYHVDALRLDAIHSIYDFSAKHLLEELKEAVENQLSRRAYLIAESDLNNSRIIETKNHGGYNLDAQWNDDFHHALHALLTKETIGYYSDFGKVEDLAKAITDRFVYDGKYSNFRKRNHGNSAKGLPGEKFVVSIQTHDQIGNRPHGDRLSTLISQDTLKLAASLLILSPNIPMLFMGEEYGETNPFLYFIDHGDKDLIKAVREGRKKKLSEFGIKKMPHPESEKTFTDSKLNWNLAKVKKHKDLLNLYKELIQFRKDFLIPYIYDPNNVEVKFDEKAKSLEIQYTLKEEKLLSITASFSKKTIKTK